MNEMMSSRRSRVSLSDWTLSAVPASYPKVEAFRRVFPNLAHPSPSALGNLLKKHKDSNVEGKWVVKLPRLTREKVALWSVEVRGEAGVAPAPSPRNDTA